MSELVDGLLSLHKNGLKPEIGALDLERTTTRQKATPGR
jgi:hypothetical protein